MKWSASALAEVWAAPPWERLRLPVPPDGRPDQAARWLGVLAAWRLCLDDVPRRAMLRRYRDRALGRRQDEDGERLLELLRQAPRGSGRFDPDRQLAWVLLAWLADGLTRGRSFAASSARLAVVLRLRDGESLGQAVEQLQRVVDEVTRLAQVLAGGAADADLWLRWAHRRSLSRLAKRPLPLQGLLLSLVRGAARVLDRVALLDNVLMQNHSGPAGWEAVVLPGILGGAGLRRHPLARLVGTWARVRGGAARTWLDWSDLLVQELRAAREASWSGWPPIWRFRRRGASWHPIREPSPRPAPGPWLGAMLRQRLPCAPDLALTIAMSASFANDLDRHARHAAPSLNGWARFLAILRAPPDPLADRRAAVAPRFWHRSAWPVVDADGVVWTTSRLFQAWLDALLQWDDWRAGVVLRPVHPNGEVVLDRVVPRLERAARLFAPDLPRIRQAEPWREQVVMESLTTEIAEE